MMKRETELVINTRMMALELIMEIMEQKKYADLVIHEALSVHQFIDKSFRAFLTRLVQGTVERCLEIDYLLDKFSKVTTKKMKPVIRNILRLSVYQILYMDQVPDSAACNEAVKLTEKKGFSGLKGFVNGVLRNISRSKEKNSLPYPKKEDIITYFSVKYSTPKWIVALWLQEYGQEDTEKMLFSQYEEERMGTISIRRRKMIGEEILLQQLSKEHCHIEKETCLSYAYRLSGYDFLEGMQSFQKGWFQVMDISSMLAVEAAGIKKDMVILDVCAAPGGKSIFAADCMEGTGLVIARDITKEKLIKIEETIERFGCNNIKTECYDARVLDKTMVEKADLVIADLPCSGLGVIGHKNDIKYHITKETVQELKKLQREILSVVWQYVRPGGTLIFSTCTVNKEENEEGRDWILQNTPLKEDSLIPFLPKQFSQNLSVSKGYLQLRQGMNEMDGFFISRFRRV